MDTYKIFTYGSLKRGHNNHEYLKGSKFLGEWETGPGYTKISKGLPYLLVDSNGLGCSGEAYEVSELTLKLLDRLEGHPDWYQRTLIKIYRPEKDLVMNAYTYLMPKERI